MVLFTPRIWITIQTHCGLTQSSNIACLKVIDLSKCYFYSLYQITLPNFILWKSYYVFVKCIQLQNRAQHCWQTSLDKDLWWSKEPTLLYQEISVSYAVFVKMLYLCALSRDSVRFPGDDSGQSNWKKYINTAP